MTGPLLGGANEKFRSFSRQREEQKWPPSQSAWPEELLVSSANFFFSSVVSSVYWQTANSSG